MKHSSFSLFAPFAAALLCAAVIGGPRLQAAEEPAKKNPAAKSQLSAGDEKFVKTAGADGLAEVKLGELARDKANGPGVKEFGEMMASDHGKANEELKELAMKKGVTLPDKLEAKHQQTADKLGKLSGEAFDKAYAAEMVKAHKSAVSLFEGEAKSGKDADLKAFAEKTLPTLKTHLEKAQGLQGGSDKKADKK